MARDYKAEASRESKERKAGRAASNRARLKMLKMLTRKYGEAVAKRMMEGKHVDHIKPKSQGGSNATSNLRLRDAKENISDKGTIFKGKRTTRPKRRD